MKKQKPPFKEEGGFSYCANVVRRLFVSANKASNSQADFLFGFANTAECALVWPECDCETDCARALTLFIKWYASLARLFQPHLIRTLVACELQTGHYAERHCLFGLKQVIMPQAELRSNWMLDERERSRHYFSINRAGSSLRSAANAPECLQERGGTEIAEESIRNYILLRVLWHGSSRAVLPLRTSANRTGVLPYRSDFLHVR